MQGSIVLFCDMFRKCTVLLGILKNKLKSECYPQKRLTNQAVSRQPLWKLSIASDRCHRLRNAIALPLQDKNYFIYLSGTHFTVNSHLDFSV